MGTLIAGIVIFAGAHLFSLLLPDLSETGLSFAWVKAPIRGFIRWFPWRALA